MLRPGKTRTVRALMTASSARSRDAAALYRQALLTRGDPALDQRVLRCCQQLAAGAAAIYPRDMAASCPR